MKWPWSKKPTPEEPASPGEIDDWTVTNGDWYGAERCHCGQRRAWDYPGIVGKYDVCPKCGHKDKWSTFVARETWQESPSRRAACASAGREYTDRDKWRRNIQTERWTPEHCPIKECE